MHPAPLRTPAGVVSPAWSLFEPQRQGRTRGDGATCVREQLVRDVAAVDDRITPVVESDAFGEQLRADAVTVALDHVNDQVTAHRQVRSRVVRSGRGSTGACVDAEHGPFRSWST